MARPRYTGEMRNDRRCNAMQTSHCVVASAEWKYHVETRWDGVPRHKAHRKILNRRKRSPNASHRCRLPRATTPGALYWAENSAIKDISSGVFVLLRGRNAFLSFWKRRVYHSRKKEKWICKILIQLLSYTCYEYGNFLCAKKIFPTCFFSFLFI